MKPDKITIGCLTSITILIAALAVSLVINYRQDRAAIERFKYEHREVVINGKTPAEVIAQFGPAYARDGDRLIMYKETAQGLYCTILFEEGRATEVSFHFQ